MPPWGGWRVLWLVFSSLPRHTDWPLLNRLWTAAFAGGSPHGYHRGDWPLAPRSNPRQFFSGTRRLRLVPLGLRSHLRDE